MFAAAAAVTLLCLVLGYLGGRSSKLSLRSAFRAACDVGSWAARLRWVLLPSPGVEDSTAYNTGNHRHLTSLHEKYGDAFVVRRNGKKVLYVRSAAAVRKVLMSSSFGKVWETDGAGATDLKSAVGSYVHNLVQPLLADPVFSNKGSKNGGPRAMLQKTFAGSPAFRKGFAAEIDAELDSWQVGKPVDALALAHDLVRSALYHAIAGDATDALHTITPAFHEALSHFVGRYTEACHDPALSSLDEEMLTLLGRSSEDVVAAFRVRHAARAAAAAEAVAEPDEANETGGNGGTAAASRANDSCMLALMLDAGCTDAEAAAVVVNTVIAGAEAPASALAHTLQELGRNRPIQERLRKEVNDVAGADGSTAEHLASLPYAKSAVLEGLRLFAPATLVKRQALVDAEVDGVGFVPHGTVVELCVTAIHADPKQFAEPMAFNPDREGPVVAAILGKERCFMPFSGGPRGCPGRYLAVTMLHNAMASIIQRFEIEAVPSAPEFTTESGAADEAERVRKFALWPKAGLPILLTPRENVKSADKAAQTSAQQPLTHGERGDARAADARRFAKAPGMAPPSLWRVKCGEGVASNENLPRVPKASSRDELPRIPKSHSRDGYHEAGHGLIPCSNSRDSTLPRVPFSNNSRDGNLPSLSCEARVSRED